MTMEDKKPWGNMFQAALAKGCDHASAATRANDWERRQKAAQTELIAEVTRLRGELEQMRGERNTIRRQTEEVIVWFHAEVTRLTDELATANSDANKWCILQNKEQVRAEAAEAALATARADGVADGLRMAEALAGRWFNQWSAFSPGNEPTRDDRAGGITYGRIQAANTIRAALQAMIPAPAKPADGWQPITYSLHFSGGDGQVNNCEAVITGRPTEGGEG
jgi:hypothetical protein